MGISLEEYLKNKEACPVCTAHGDDDHCRSTLLSREDNCLIMNSILYNDDAYDNMDVIYLQSLRGTTSEEKILEYYIRSEKLVRKIKGLNGNNVETWSYYYKTYVHDIIQDLRIQHTQDALNRIFEMLDSIEASFSNQ
jgi:hypothetical protein